MGFCYMPCSAAVKSVAYIILEVFCGRGIVGDVILVRAVIELPKLRNYDFYNSYILVFTWQITYYVVSNKNLKIDTNDVNDDF